LFAPGWVYEKYESTFKASQDKYVVHTGATQRKIRNKKAAIFY
jgi:hypothetical protein